MPFYITPQFPKRPGVLLKFLTRLGGLWSISLFHYRNHGAAFGKVLMGVRMAGRTTSLSTMPPIGKYRPL